MATKTKKAYDCVGSVRKERTRIAIETEGKSPKEILDYFRKRKQKKSNLKST